MITVVVLTIIDKIFNLNMRVAMFRIAHCLCFMLFAGLFAVVTGNSTAEAQRYHNYHSYRQAPNVHYSTRSNLNPYEVRKINHIDKQARYYRDYYSSMARAQKEMDRRIQRQADQVRREEKRKYEVALKRINSELEHERKNRTKLEKRITELEAKLKELSVNKQQNVNVVQRPVTISRQSNIEFGDRGAQPMFQEAAIPSQAGGLQGNQGAPYNQAVAPSYNDDQNVDFAFDDRQQPENPEAKVEDQKNEKRASTMWSHLRRAFW